MFSRGGNRAVVAGLKPDVADERTNRGRGRESDWFSVIIFPIFIAKLWLLRNHDLSGN